MFVFSCKYVSNSPVKETVDSILKHHPNEKIIIVDSQSGDHDYYKMFSDYDTVEVLYDINKHRVPGAFYQICKKYPDEPYYVNLQDCVLLKKSLQEFIDSDDEFTSFAYFHDTLHEETRHEYQYMKKVFSNTKYFLPNPSTTFIACFGPMYVIKNSMMKRLLNSGILENMKSVCKVDDETGERIFGLIAEQEGYNPLHFNMEGDILSKWNSMLSDNLEYFTKKFLGRT